MYRGKNTEKSAESSERCPPGKNHLAGGGGAPTCTWPSTTGRGTTAVKRGWPPGGRWRLAGDGLLARGRDDNEVMQPYAELNQSLRLTLCDMSLTDTTVSKVHDC